MKNKNVFSLNMAQIKKSREMVDNPFSSIFTYHNKYKRKIYTVHLFVNNVTETATIYSM